eukprot:157364_1
MRGHEVFRSSAKCTIICTKVTPWKQRAIIESDMQLDRMTTITDESKQDDIYFQSKHLIRGYINQISKQLNSTDTVIPMDIINICFIFYYFRCLKLSDFTLKNTLGKGAFSRVRLVTHIKSRRIFAMKKTRKSRVIDMHQETHIKQESKILSKISHPFIANIFGAFQDEYFVYTILELVPGGELYTLFRTKRSFSIYETQFYSAQIVSMFEYLHANKIIYRNLKFENILINANGYLKLIHFSTAKKFNKHAQSYKTWTLIGVPEYIAPEVLLNKGQSFECDWWSLGCIIFEMLTGSPPFIDDNPMQIYQQILENTVTFPTGLIDINAKDIIRKLLKKDVSDRLGSKNDDDVKKHLFFKDIDWEKLLREEIENVPWKPELHKPDDCIGFHLWEENSDTENVELENDLFEDFEDINRIDVLKM